MGLPWRDGKDWRPDTVPELGFILFALIGFGSLLVFTGIDADIEYVAAAPGDYFIPDSGSEDDIYFRQSDVDLMNAASEQSLGSDAIGAERLYCGELRNGVTRNYRLADVIEDSTLTSVSGRCKSPVDIWTHSHPDGSGSLSEEDKDLESTGTSHKCIQYSEISASPVNNKLNGINCWKIEGDGESFKPVNTYLR